MVASIITSAMEMAAIGYKTLTGLVVAMAMQEESLLGYVFASVHVLVYIEL